MLTLYSKQGYCPFCSMAKTLLTSKNVVFEEKIIGVDVTLEEFKSTFPGVSSVPYVIEEGHSIGGYEQLVEWCNNDRQFLVEG